MEEPAKPADLSGLRIARPQEGVSRSLHRAPAWMSLTVVALGSLLVVGYAARKAYRDGLVWPGAAEIEIYTVASPDDRAGVVLSGSGYVEPQVTADISAKIPGRLEFLAVEEGDEVRTGQLIARLENQDYRARLDLARGALAEREAAVAETEANFSEDKRERDRQSRLVAEGVSGRAVLERAEARRDASRARLQVAQAAVESARAAVAVAEADLENTLIRAPFGGVVIRQMAKVGEMVMPQSLGSNTNTKSGIVQLADFRTLEVEVDVQESNIARLKEGQPARVVLKSHPERTYQGLVRQILPTADRAQGTVLVRVRILDTDQLVLPKMQADVDFVSEKEKSSSNRESLRIPFRAVAERDGRRVVLAVEGEKLVERPIRLGETAGDEVAVLEGLRGGEQIALDPGTLRAGAAVRVRSAHRP